MRRSGALEAMSWGIEGPERMNWMSGNVVGVLVFLLPGFVAAAVFYSLTSHPKPGAFDRVIQALIFTVVGQSLVVLVEPVTGEKVSR